MHYVKPPFTRIVWPLIQRPRLRWLEKRRRQRCRAGFLHVKSGVAYDIGKRSFSA